MQAAAWTAGYGRSAPPASTATGGAVPSSAPLWAAASTPSASPDTTLTPAADRPRPMSCATVSPYWRRPPGADDGDRVVAVRALRRVAGDVQHGRRVGELAQAPG